ncbi:alpha/beta hydrolase [Leucobacter sp. HY1910]
MTGAAAAAGVVAGERPAVAAELRDGYTLLAQVQPRGVAHEGEIAAYRAAAVVRAQNPARRVRELRLVQREHNAAVTVFTDVSVAESGERPSLRVVHLHGGGLIAGDRFAGFDMTARFAKQLRLEVWAVEYPLSPAASFTDMVDAVVSVLREAVTDGVPVVLAGQSAGGGLAAAVAFECRDLGIVLAGHLLACPMLDARATVSAAQFDDDESWNGPSNRTAWTAALRGTNALPPGERTDLAGLAPVFVDTGSAELFRSSITGFAGRLWEAGVTAELHVWSGAFHASDFAVEEAIVSQEAHRARGRWLERLIEGRL